MRGTSSVSLSSSLGWSRCCSAGSAGLSRRPLWTSGRSRPRPRSARRFRFRRSLADSRSPAESCCWSSQANVAPRRRARFARDNERMNERAYAVARLVAPRIHAHFSAHQSLDRRPGSIAVDTIPNEAAIEAMIDTAFWASLRREEAYVPKISLAFLAPADTDHPLVLEHSLPLDAAVLTRVSPAVERPGIHLGVAYVNGELRVWGT